MAWHLAPSLAQLRSEINSRWPGRDKTSDGTIGDTAHSNTASDHNPNARGSVNAIDIDKDGVNIAAIKAAAERHPSVHYWIYNRQIADRDNGFDPQPYNGPNPHDKHIHISIRQTAAAENDTRSWGVAMLDTDDKAYLVSLVETRLNQFIPRLVTSALGADQGQDLLETAVSSALHQRNVGASGVTFAVMQHRIYNTVLAEAARDEDTRQQIIAAINADDDIDSAAVASQVLAGLLPSLNAEAIAAAIPANIAEQVADELHARLAG